MPTNWSSSRASSWAVRSSCRWPGVRSTVRKIPDRKCECIATLTFSSAVIRPKRRMFWKVRAMPSEAILLGLSPVTLRPPSSTRPLATLYKPVRALKKVVLPAPLGPIRLTMPPPGMVKLTLSTATSPPKRTVISSARRASGVPVSTSIVLAVAQHQPGAALRQEALPPEQHHQHQRAAEDQEAVRREVDVGAERGVEGGAQLRQPGRVEPGEQEGAQHDAPHVAHATEDHHREQRDRDGELEPVRQDPADVGGERDTRHAAGHRADAVGGELGAHQRYPHSAGGQLVLADGQPGTTQPTLPQAKRHEEDEQGQHQEDEVSREVVERAEGAELDPLRADRQALHRVDRRDALRAIGDVDAVDVVAVVEDLRDDLAEAERDQGQVVAAQPQRLRTDESRYPMVSR